MAQDRPSPTLTQTALAGGKLAATLAADGARLGARLAVGTVYAGCSVLVDVGKRAARWLPIDFGSSEATDESNEVGWALPTPPSEGTPANESEKGESADIAPLTAQAALKGDAHPTSSAQPVGGTQPVRAATHDDDSAFADAVRQVTRPLYLIEDGGRLAIGLNGQGPAALRRAMANSNGTFPLRGVVPAMHPSQLGDPGFREDHGLKYNYVAGAMANGIASVELVEAVSRAGMLGFFGAAGLSLERIEAAIDRLQASLDGLPFGFNLIHSPHEPRLEAGTTDLYIRRNIRLAEASAFLDLTLPLVKYRVHGIHRDRHGRIASPNRLVAKVSRVEVARKFFAPPPEGLLEKLVTSGDISAEQANLARRIPMAEDLTAEADSGGHTDNRPAVTLIPTMLALRDEMQQAYDYDRPLRVGAAGGIATPASVAAAFSMGAAYVVTGSINQACVESGTSPTVREMLCKASQADVMMTPAADMFEMGVQVQVLKWGTMFALKGRKLYELYRNFGSLEEIPAAQRATLEREYFRCTLEETWNQTRSYFETRDPSQIARAEADPKHRMALVFRSYLGQSSNWANCGDPTRKTDYQIWCGPAMGAFNEWVKGTHIEPPAGRRVAEVGMNLLLGAAILTRVNWLRTQGIALSPRVQRMRPMRLEEIETLLA